MPTAPSLDTAVCTDIARWHIKNFGAIDTLLLDRPISLGYTCITDFCLELFKPSDNYIKPVEGTDYTLDETAGTITFLSTSSHTWGQTGHGEEQWTMIAYFNDLPCEPEPECKAIICCDPDIHGFRSADATDSEAGNNEGCPEVLIDIWPPGGSVLIFPSYVVLSSNVEEADIRYTTDGTDPDEFSTLYTVPFQVASAGTIVKARGFISGCSPGPIMAVTFQNPPFQIALAYACDTPDNGGTWDVWAPNGTVDNHWQLAFTLAALTTITRLELYQLDADGNWTTGIAWSTDSPINPDGGDDFDVFPLLVFVAAVQQWAAYQSSLGAFPAASYVWDLYGERAFAVSGFFRFDMILGDGTKISQIINTTCTGVLPPVTCPSPAQPTLTAKCDGAIDVIFTGPVGRDYRVYYSDGGAWVLGASGNIAASPVTHEITGLIEGGFYYVRVDIDYVDCGFRASIYNTVTTLRDPVVSISTDKTEVDPNESFTISWTSNHIGGAVCGGCLDGQVSINQSMGCKAGNTAGSQAQSQATPGVYTYTITGCNACRTVVSSVQVTVRGTALCLGIQPDTINFPSPLNLFCPYTNVQSCGCSSDGYAGFPWNGEMWRVGTSCRWESPDGAGGLCDGSIKPDGSFNDDHGNSGNPPYLKVVIELLGGKWILKPCIFGGSEANWIGEKLTGTTPLGTYTKVSGCATGPATITIT